ncbi:hypothetical protein [Nocardiopsis nanhaiensis]
MASNVFEDKSNETIRALSRLPDAFAPPSLKEPVLRSALSALRRRPDHAKPTCWLVHELGDSCARTALEYEWAELCHPLTYHPWQSDAPGTVNDPGVLFAQRAAHIGWHPQLGFGDEEELSDHLAALFQDESLVERAAALCRYGRYRTLGALIEHRITQDLFSWVARHRPEEAVGAVLAELVAALNAEFPAPVHTAREKLRPRAVSGESRFPISVRGIAHGSQTTLITSRIKLPRPHKTEGQVSCLHWEGFSRLEDDLGHLYLLRLDTEKQGRGRMGTDEEVTQVVIPAIVPQARRLYLTSPGYWESQFQKLEGHLRGRPVHTSVPDKAMVSVDLT